jgi:hypothetical protein
LTDLWAITAAHCLSGKEKTLTILCPKKHDKYSAKKFRLRAQERHATHDVTLLQFARSSFCFGDTVNITRRIEENASFFTETLPKVQVIASKNSLVSNHAPLVEVSRDDHTLQLHDNTACLTKGDSGYPVFVEGTGPPYELGGLLISGLEGCPSLQTVVRTDRLSEWISKKIDEKLCFCDSISGGLK